MYRIKRFYPTSVALIVIYVIGVFLAIGEAKPQRSALSDIETSKWRVVSSGGKTSSTPDLLITGTISQTAVNFGQSGNLIIRHGFWQDFGADSCSGQRPGDANGDGSITNADIDYLRNFLCAGGPPPVTLANGDPNGDCTIDTTDMVFLGKYLSGSGSAPVACTCLDPHIGSCTSPDFCNNSRTDPVFVVCPGGDMPFHVYLRDIIGRPVVGQSAVRIDFMDCQNIHTCPSSNGSFTTLYPISPSDSSGMLTYYLDGANCDMACMAIVRTSSCIIDTVPVKTFDISGDEVVSASSDFNMSACNDYTGDSKVDYRDYRFFSKHIGHRCALTPCEQISANLYTIPQTNIGPNQTISVQLEITNNSSDTCTIGNAAFFVAGYGTGTSESFIQNVMVDSTLRPGRSIVVKIPYLVPDTTCRCLIARYTASCCSTSAEVSYCFCPHQHCNPGEQVCYDMRVLLDSVPVAKTNWEYFLPTGWSSLTTYTPTFPLSTKDSLLYNICSPNLSNLGDTAAVVLTVCFDDSCTKFRQFERWVMVTSQTGDANGDCHVNVGDVVYLINYIFKGGPPPHPMAAGDPNCDGKVNVGDAVYLINLIFKGGPSPCMVGWPIP